VDVHFRHQLVCYSPPTSSLLSLKAVFYYRKNFTARCALHAIARSIRTVVCLMRYISQMAHSFHLDILKNAKHANIFHSHDSRLLLDMTILHSHGWRQRAIVSPWLGCGGFAIASLKHPAFIKPRKRRGRKTARRRRRRRWDDLRHALSWRSMVLNSAVAGYVIFA